VQWRILVEHPPRRTVVVDGKAAAEHQASATAGAHGRQQPFGADHGAGELGVLAATDHRGQVQEDIDAIECARQFG
jgi:hypothetical protein